ncbi:uncharacterized protein [Haliotis asinina]|uniref:uncharacterized protein n=1 Tax=Haliotis asinina TaxID=109174 RepID=UPI0035322F73
MANTELVSSDVTHVCISSSSDSPGGENSNVTLQRGGATSSVQKDPSDGVPFIRTYLQRQGLSHDTISIIMNSWRGGTQKQYKTYLLKYMEYCTRLGRDPLLPNIGTVLDFLKLLFDSGCGYSAINTARSALSAVLILPSGMPVGQHPLVKRFLRGIFNLRPSLPRYQHVWDVKIVLDYLESLGKNEELSLKTLTLKFSMLLALVSGQRSQSLQLLSLDNMSRVGSKVVFVLTSLVKQSRPGVHVQPIEIEAFENENLCVVKCLEAYVSRTEHIREGKQLLVSFNAPHRAVTRETISRWLRLTLAAAGIDTTIYSGHSTRAASTSAAHMQGAPMQCIMGAAGWASAGVFARFYCKPMHKEHSFGEAVLSSSNLANPL